jgi:hypothetical protein
MRSKASAEELEFSAFSRMAKRIAFSKEPQQYGFVQEEFFGLDDAAGVDLCSAPDNASAAH